MEQQGLTRREMLERGIAVMGAGGLALAGLTGSGWPSDEAAAATLPDVTITHHGAAPAGDPPYFLLTPSAGRGTPGLMILDRAGGIVWYSPNSSKTTQRLDLKVQSYQGRPVLTWWEGQVFQGYGRGHVVIADSSYRTVATVSA